MRLGGDIYGNPGEEEWASNIDISGDGFRVVIGAPFVGGAGQAAVYQYDWPNWRRLGRIVEGDNENDQLGSAVAMSRDGTAIAVRGRETRNFRGEESRRRRGRETRTFCGEESRRRRGRDVDIPRRRVSQVGASNHGDLYQGLARVYEIEGCASPPTMQPTMTAAPTTTTASCAVQIGQDVDGGQEDQSGGAVAMSYHGTRMIVGAAEFDGWNFGAKPNSGGASVYEFDGSEWSRLGITIQGENTGDRSGSSVAISSDGSRVALGAPLNKGGGSSNRGHARVFEYGFVTFRYDWFQLGSDIDGQAKGDRFGTSVSMDADGTVPAEWNSFALARPLETGSRPPGGRDRIAPAGRPKDGARRAAETGSRPRAAERWRPSRGRDQIAPAGCRGGSPLQRQRQDRPERRPRTGGRAEVSRLGPLAPRTILVVAAASPRPVSAKYPCHVARPSQVQVFSWVGSDWGQLGLDVLGTTAGDNLGSVVAVSADGFKLAVGATGNSPGYVRVYALEFGTWAQIGGDLDGFRTNDKFGRALAISADGSKIAVTVAARTFRRRVAATPRPRRGYSVETRRSWLRRGRSVETDTRLRSAVRATYALSSFTPRPGT